MKNDIREPMQKSRKEFIEDFYSKRKADYICKTLNEEELFVIDGTDGLSVKDYLVLAKVKRILQNGELSNYIDKNYMVKPEFAGDYIGQGRSWMQHEWNILEWNLHEHGVNRDPTEREFRDDFDEYQNGLRFKLFYLLSNTDRVIER